MITKNKTLIMIPTYNERNNIDFLISKLRKLKKKFDILFIDDNSPDGTGKILNKMAVNNKRIKVFHRKKKLGIGSAHLDGLDWAYRNKYQRLITLDGDLTHSPEDIEKFFVKIENFDVVVGSRFIRKNSLKGWSLHRKILTYLGHFVTNIGLGLKFDSTCGFRIYNLKSIRKRIFKMVRSNGYSFFIESLFLLKENKYKISEIPIVLPKRAWGSSKMKISDIAKSIFVISKLFFLRFFNSKIFILKKKLNINENLIKKERIEWDDYWKEKTSSIKHIYNFIAFFYRVIIIKPALNYFFFKYNKIPMSKTLHAGCGSGQVDVNLAQKTNLTALDISPKALFKYRNFHDDNVEIIHGDIFNMPFNKNKFNIIFNLGVMEHFTEAQIKQILSEFKRTLKDDGTIILFWPPRYGLSVKFLKILKKMIYFFVKKNIVFHPDEITLIKSKKHAEKILKNSGFNIVQSYFGIRDFFTHEIIVARKN